MSDFFKKFREAQDALKKPLPEKYYVPPVQTKAAPKRSEKEPDWVMIFLICLLLVSGALIIGGAVGQISHAVSQRDLCEATGRESVTIRKTVLCVDDAGNLSVPRASEG